MLHFRGAPHVHAFVNVAWDAERPLSVGELLGDNPTALEGAAVQAFFERAMRHAAGADFAHYAPDAVAGRLRRGPIRTGDLFVLESWNDDVFVGTVRGAHLSERFARELTARGASIDPAHTYKVAATSADAEVLKGAERTRRVLPLREAAVALARDVGFG